MTEWRGQDIYTSIDAFAQGSNERVGAWEERSLEGNTKRADLSQEHQFARCVDEPNHPAAQGPRG
jgi:hypothetical protein